MDTDEKPNARGTARELNLDGLVGPTHHYAGLAWGNLASQEHRGEESNPRAAALQGLDKMKLLADLGVPQAVLPPQERPDVGALRRLGFSGSDAEVLATAQRKEPALLAACASASSMWAANAATVSPSADADDGRAHFTPANLAAQFHRSIETPTTARLLRAIFDDDATFAHHEALPAAGQFGDEGAANHTRLCGDYGRRGLEIFAYGKSAISDAGPRKFPARQTLEASLAVARLHQLNGANIIFVRQNPAAIDAGAFHSDVVAVGNANVFLYHELAFDDAGGLAREIEERWRGLGEGPAHVIPVAQARVALADAARTYLFNSQLVTLGDGGMMLLAPRECEEHEGVRGFLEELAGAANPIATVRFVEVRQSMHNGGGPACLRLRVALTQIELMKMHQGVLLTPGLYERLAAWVRRHYRESLRPEDLADVKLLEEGRAALDELTRILGLGRIYAFQG